MMRIIQRRPPCATGTDHKQHTRDRIVEAASRGFREHGVDGLGRRGGDGRARADARRLLRAFPRQGGARPAACERALRGRVGGLRSPAGCHAPRTAVRRIARSYLSPARRAGARRRLSDCRARRRAGAQRAGGASRHGHGEVDARLTTARAADAGTHGGSAGGTPPRCSSRCWSARWCCRGCCRRRRGAAACAVTQRLIGPRPTRAVDASAATSIAERARS